MKKYELYLYALDPVHIGAGGYSLGRVDNTIQRDAGTGLPKVPGTSISGATRTAAIYSLPDSDERNKAMEYARAVLDPKRGSKELRGKDDPVARVFGYADGEEGDARIGCISFRDAQIVAFPVPTVAGPRWITTSHLLQECGCSDLPKGTRPAEVIVQQSEDAARRVNLGWLLFPCRQDKIPFPAALAGMPGMEYVQDRLVLVHDNVYSALVNANLETRTSVAIDFESGAAAPGKLFTFEATPRGTLFRSELELDDDRFPHLAAEVATVLKRALKLACAWGLGGMTTRGFGRCNPILAEVSP